MRLQRIRRLQRRLFSTTPPSDLPFPLLPYVSSEFTSSLHSDRELIVASPRSPSESLSLPSISASSLPHVLDSIRNPPACSMTRADHLTQISQKIKSNTSEMASLLAWESGKSVTEATGEIYYAISYLDHFAREISNPTGSVISTNPSRHSYTTSHPVGLVFSVTPWNFPLAMFARKFAPAYAAGCPFLLKPSELTPLTSLFFAHITRDILPKGVFTVIPSDDRDLVRDALLDSDVRKFSFTGSTETGRVLAKLAIGSNLKRLSLELGGNAPFVIFADADMDQASKGLSLSKFRNAGQTCVCANRIYVQDTSLDLFLNTFLKRLNENPDQLPFDQPLISTSQSDRVEGMVSEALRAGAKEVWSFDDSKSPSSSPSYVRPRVLVDVPIDCDLATKEIFGPICVISTFQDETEVLRKCNDSEHGLASYVYTSDVSRSIRFPRSLHYGMVGVNEGIISDARAPFGGVKQSGQGREGGFRSGLSEYLDEKYVCVGGIE